MNSVKQKEPPDIPLQNKYDVLGRMEVRNQKKRKFNSRTESFFSGTKQIQNNGSKFLIMKTLKENTSLKRISPFVIQATINDYVTGPLNKVKRLLDGTILIETNTHKQADQLMKIKKLYDVEKTGIQVIEHPFLNTSKAVAFCDDFEFMSDSEILEGLKSQGITELRRMTRINQEQKRENTNGCIFTFNRIQPPKEIYVGFHIVETRLYIPNPMRCNNCQKFNHSAKKCNVNTPTCGKCAEDSTGHKKIEVTINDKPVIHIKCDNLEKCPNCNGSHAAWKRICPVFQKEYEVQKIKITQRITLREAKQIYRQLYPNRETSQTYSNIARSNNNIRKNTDNPKNEREQKSAATQSKPINQQKNSTTQQKLQNENSTNNQTDQSTAHNPNTTSALTNLPTISESQNHPFEHHSKTIFSIPTISQTQSNSAVEIMDSDDGELHSDDMQ